MEYRTIGRSGLRVSLLGLGCNNFGGRMDFPKTQAVVHRALDLGITFFDTADIYGGGGRSEEFLGRLLGERRREIVLATKFGKPFDGDDRLRGASRSYTIAAVDASLKRLRTDWIDLLFLHEPDPSTPIDETLRAIEDLVGQGKLRYFGSSNMPAWQVVEAELTARRLGTSGIAACQDEYSLLVRGIEGELVPAARAYGIGIVPYFPLAAGLLTGKYEQDLPLPNGVRITAGSDYHGRYWTERNWSIIERLKAFGRPRGYSLLDLAFAWLTGQPSVSSVIAGATKPEQLDGNLAAIGRTLGPDELAEVERIAR